MSSRFQINGTVVAVDDTTTRNLQVVMLVVANCAHEIEPKYLAHIIYPYAEFRIDPTDDYTALSTMQQRKRRVGIKEKIPFSIFISHSSRIFFIFLAKLPR